MLRLVAAFSFVILAVLGSSLSASAETRTLKIYFIHTKERAEITYKKDGRYIKSGLEKANWILRDWRRNEATNMDPKLLDILWEVYRASGSRDYIHALSGYRSPVTNAALRSRSSGVAENSLHRLGKALDFYLPDVPLKKIRDIGLKLHLGGVGYYPRSGSPFVHLDSGSIRHWPRMSRQELAAVFPDGRTIHVPTDGKPFSGYQQVLASTKARQSGAPIQVVAEVDTTKRPRGGGVLRRIFGGGVEEEEDNIESARTQMAANRAPAQGAPRQVQAESPNIRQAAPQTPGAILAALPARDIPLPTAAPRSSAPIIAAVASAQPTSRVPEVIPFQTVASADIELVNIPRPTPRPNYTPQIAVVAEQTEPSVLTAFAEENSRLPQVISVLPTKRPAYNNGADAIASLISAPVAKKDDTVLAAYAPVETGTSSKRDIRPTIAVDSQAAQVQVASLIDAGASKSATKTSRSNHAASKSSRVGLDDVPPALKPNVMKVSTNVPATLLDEKSVGQKVQQIETPAYTARLAETPSAVYTTGFTRNNDQADPRRLSGNAVTFLAIAKFN